MKLTIVYLALSILLVVSLVGCNSTSVTRAYDQNLDTVWKAVIKTANDMSTEKPSLDEDNHKLTTGLIFVNTSATRGEGSSIVRSTDLWRAFVKCQKDGKKTKVTVNVQTGNASNTEPSDVNAKPDKTITVQLNGNDTSLQDSFFIKLEEELKSPDKDKSRVNITH